MATYSRQGLMITRLGSRIRPLASATQYSRGIAIRLSRLPGLRMEIDSHLYHVITRSGSGIRPLASASQSSSGIAVQLTRLPGLRMEPDSHQSHMIKQSGSGIRPPATTNQPSMSTPPISFNLIKSITIIYTLQLVHLI